MIRYGKAEPWKIIYDFAGRTHPERAPARRRKRGTKNDGRKFDTASELLRSYRPPKTSTPAIVTGKKKGKGRLPSTPPTTDDEYEPSWYVVKLSSMHRGEQREPSAHATNFRAAANLPTHRLITRHDPPSPARLRPTPPSPRTLLVPPSINPPARSPTSSPPAPRQNSPSRLMDGPTSP